MFSPFEKFTVGKISEEPSKNTLITAIGWANGYLKPAIPKPIIAISSSKGHVLIYDISSRSIIGNIHFNDQIISILWSAFNPNLFYCGSNSGHLYICEYIDRKTIQIRKILHFIANSNESKENALKSIDFITQDDVDGFTLAIASKDGSIGYVTNLNEPENAKLQVFQNIDFLVPNKDSNFNVNFFEFYPNNTDFVTIATNQSTYLISLSKGILIPFIPMKNCRFISLINKEQDKVIVGDDNDIVVWKLVNQSWVRSNILKIGSKFDFTEILTFSKQNDQLLLTTASNWLTRVEYRNNKSFVSQRIKMIDGVPIDYAFGHGSIAFLTGNNSILFTSKTPESIIKTEKSESDSSDDVSQVFHVVDDSNLDEPSEAPNYATLETDENDLSNSMTLENNSFTPVADLENQYLMRNGSDNEIHLVRSESDILNKNAGFGSQANDSLLGNSNTISLSFKIKENDETIKLKNIEWISSQKVIVWGKKCFYVIDLNSRTITDPLQTKFDKKSNFIDQIFFSKSHKIMCMLLNHKRLYVIDTENDLKIINSVNFGKLVKKEKKCLFGSVSPKEDQIVLASQNSLFFVNLNDKNILKHINSSLEFKATFISWKERGIVIGTEKGSVFLILKKKIDNIIKSAEMNNRSVKVIYESARNGKKKMGPIKSVLSCRNHGLIILDSYNKGIVVSKDVKILAESIRVLKQSSTDTFLVRLQNYDKLVVINAFGDFSPPLPPCYYLAKKNNISFKSSRIDLNESEPFDSITSQLFNTKESNHSIPLRNSVLLLNQILSFHDSFASRSSKAFLALGHLEKARNLLIRTEPNDKDYVNNMMLAALYNSCSDQSESIDLVIKGLISNNLITKAVDILLITKEHFKVAEILYKFDRNVDAYFILMLNHEYVSDHLKNLIPKIANSLISQKQNAIYGLKLLSTFGYTNEMINELSLIL